MFSIFEWQDLALVNRTRRLNRLGRLIGYRTETFLAATSEYGYGLHQGIRLTLPLVALAQMPSPPPSPCSTAVAASGEVVERWGVMGRDGEGGEQVPECGVLAYVTNNFSGSVLLVFSLICHVRVTSSEVRRFQPHTIPSQAYAHHHQSCRNRSAKTMPRRGGSFYFLWIIE